MSSFTFTEVVRLAQVGVREQGRSMLRALAALPGADLVVVCDEDDAVLSSASRTAPSARTTTRTETVLADASVAGVVLADAAPEMIEAFLEAGKHVLASSPLAPTVEQVERLADLAQARGVRLMVNHPLRYHPALQRLLECVQQDDLGALRTLSWTLHTLRPSPDHSVLDALLASALSVAHALVGTSPVAVTAVGHAHESGADDVVMLTVAFDGGALLHVDASHVSSRAARQLSVVGSEGQATFDDFAPMDPLRLYERRGDASEGGRWSEPLRSGAISIPNVAPTDPLTLVGREFVASIREQRPPLTDASDDVAVVRLVDAARRSLDAGGERIALADA